MKTETQQELEILLPEGFSIGGAQLYEKAGIHVHRSFDLFEKALRSRIEISVQSLSQ